MKNWKIKKGHDFRIRARHPWVFSNELLDSPKGILPGEPIELTDMQGHFLARGYGNPHSLIAFRAMSFSARENFEMQPDFLVQRLLRSWGFRYRSGFRDSHRLCYSEADQMPGLIVDRYVFAKQNQRYQVFSYQLLTAGMDVVFRTHESWQVIFRQLSEQALQAGYSDIGWDHTIVLQRNDVNIRKLEGLAVEAPLIQKTIGEENLTDVAIQIQNVLAPETSVLFHVNLAEGQKTGFFLDQTFNMKLLLQQLEKRRHEWQGKKIRILDLCCYMGQWSAQIVTNLRLWGIESEVHLVDVSELALQKARQNLLQYTDTVLTHKADVMELLQINPLNELRFDVVISDPPAFVKNKKDLPQGLAAYTKLNLQAFRLCAPGATVVSCTCSGLVGLEDFKEALRKAVLKSGLNARCLAYGGQGWDHPHLMSFPEGYYLKMVMHQVDWE